MRLIKWWRMEERVKGMPVDAFVAMMDAARLDKALIPAIRMMSYQKKTMVWDITEEEVAAAVKQRPDRLVGLAGFNPLQKMDGVRRVERAIKELGFKGVYIHTYGFGIPLNDRLYYPLYANAWSSMFRFPCRSGTRPNICPMSLDGPSISTSSRSTFPS